MRQVALRPGVFEMPQKLPLWPFGLAEGPPGRPPVAPLALLGSRCGARGVARGGLGGPGGALWAPLRDLLAMHLFLLCASVYRKKGALARGVRGGSLETSMGLRLTPANGSTCLLGSPGRPLVSPLALLGSRCGVRGVARGGPGGPGGALWAPLGVLLAMHLFFSVHLCTGKRCIGSGCPGGVPRYL